MVRLQCGLEDAGLFCCEMGMLDAGYCVLFGAHIQPHIVAHKLRYHWRQASLARMIVRESCHVSAQAAQKQLVEKAGREDLVQVHKGRPDGLSATVEKFAPVLDLLRKKDVLCVVLFPEMAQQHISITMKRVVRGVCPNYSERTAQKMVMRLGWPYCPPP